MRAHLVEMETEPEITTEAEMETTEAIMMAATAAAASKGKDKGKDKGDDADGDDDGDDDTGLYCGSFLGGAGAGDDRIGMVHEELYDMGSTGTSGSRESSGELSPPLSLFHVNDMNMAAHGVGAHANAVMPRGAFYGGMYGSKSGDVGSSGATPCFWYGRSSPTDNGNSSSTDSNSNSSSDSSSRSKRASVCRASSLTSAASGVTAAATASAVASAAAKLIVEAEVDQLRKENTELSAQVKMSE